MFNLLAKALEINSQIKPMRSRYVVVNSWWSFSNVGLWKYKLGISACLKSLYAKHLKITWYSCRLKATLGKKEETKELERTDVDTMRSQLCAKQKRK